MIFIGLRGGQDKIDVFDAIRQAMRRIRPFVRLVTDARVCDEEVTRYGNVYFDFLKAYVRPNFL